MFLNTQYLVISFSVIYNFHDSEYSYCGLLGYDIVWSG
jgi:hypothetical protein